MSGALRLRRCSVCGVPRFLSFFLRWNPNGTITQLMNPCFRAVILSAGFINELFQNISSFLGVSIDHVVAEAQRNASRAVFDTVYDRMPTAKYLSRFDFVKRRTIESFHRIAAAMGQFRSDTIEYVPGVRGVARVKNPFNLQLCGAIIAGALESLDGVPYDHEWEKEDKNLYVIRVTPSSCRSELSERLKIEMPPIIPGSFQHKRCQKCRTPLSLSDLEWNEDEGTITGKRYGARLVFLDGYMVRTVFRELKKELGEDADEVIINAQKRWMLVHFGELEDIREIEGGRPENVEERIRGAFAMLPILGHGNPVSVRVSRDELFLRIENPYEKYVLAGSASAAYEKLFGLPGRVSLTMIGESIAEYRVKPS